LELGLGMRLGESLDGIARFASEVHGGRALGSVMGVSNMPIQMVQNRKPKTFPKHHENCVGHGKNYVLCRKNYIRLNSNYIRPFSRLCKSLKNKLLQQIESGRLFCWKPKRCAASLILDVFVYVAWAVILDVFEKVLIKLIRSLSSLLFIIYFCKEIK